MNEWGRDRAPPMELLAVVSCLTFPPVVLIGDLFDRFFSFFSIGVEFV